MPKFVRLAVVGWLLPAAAFAQTQLTQTVRGTVTDQVLQTPLPGATIVLLDSSPQRGTLSERDGAFRLEKIPVGRRSFKISSLGYRDAVVANVAVEAGKELVLTVALEEAVTELSGVTVKPTLEKDKPLNDMAAVSARTFSVEETQRFAAAVNDPARMATAYAGVVGADDGGNTIVIRGNAPNGLLWRMEGVEIPNPNHFAPFGSAGGGISILSAQVLTNSDFLTGAFPAEYGNALSGVFDLRLRRGNNTKREHTVQAGFLGIDVASEGPFSKKPNAARSKASYLFNYRYSTLGLLARLGAPVGTATTLFQDLSFNVFLPTRKAGTFTLFGFGGLSTSDTRAERDSTRWATAYDRHDDRFTANTGAAGLTHTLPLGAKATLKTVLLGSGYRTTGYLERLNESYQPELRAQESFLTRKAVFSTTLNYKFSPRSSLRAGLIGTDIRYELLRKEFDREQARLFTTLQSGDGTQTLQGFAQTQVRFGEALTLNAGLHYLRLRLNGSQVLEPRGSLRWAFAPRQAVSLGYGLHSQMQTLGTYFGRPRGAETAALPNRDLGFTRSHHFVAAYDLRLSDHLRLKAEAYHQALFNVPVSADVRDGFALLNSFDGLTARRLVNRGRGRNQGLELTVERFLDRGLYFLLSSSLYDSRYAGSDGVWRNTRFNGRYASSFLAGKELVVGHNRNHTLGLNVKLSHYGGYRESPIDATASRVKGETVFVEDRLFTEKLPDYFRADVRLSWKKDRPRSTRTLSLDVQNVTNRQNIAGRFFDPQSGTVKTFYLTGLIPVLSYRVAF